MLSVNSYGISPKTLDQTPVNDDIGSPSTETSLASIQLDLLIILVDFVDILNALQGLIIRTVI